MQVSSQVPGTARDGALSPWPESHRHHHRLQRPGKQRQRQRRHGSPGRPQASLRYVARHTRQGGLLLSLSHLTRACIASRARCCCRARLLRSLLRTPFRRPLAALSRGLTPRSRCSPPAFCPMPPGALLYLLHAQRFLCGTRNNAHTAHLKGGTTDTQADAGRTVGIPPGAAWRAALEQAVAEGAQQVRVLRVLAKSQGAAGFKHSQTGALAAVNPRQQFILLVSILPSGSSWRPPHGRHTPPPGSGHHRRNGSEDNRRCGPSRWNSRSGDARGIAGERGGAYGGSRICSRR